MKQIDDTTHMYEWLELEISQIKTPRFHVIQGPPDAKLREAVMRSDLPLPPAYRDFILKFGSAKLYRVARSNAYLIGIFGAPREALEKDGRRIYHIGFHDGASLYLKPASNGQSIFEFESGVEEKVAEDFAEWLSASCIRARSRLGRKKWAEILRGPKPFTAKENDIINARRLMRWRVLGINLEGDHIFEIQNLGTNTLSEFTLGLRSKNGRLNGTIRLKTENIGPGMTEILHADCYKKLMPPEEMEVFSLPDPKPEDRDQYGEFTHSHIA